MTARPALETVRSPKWIAALAAIIGAIGFAYFPLLNYSFHEWLKPDYSHGFLVPIFACYLAWMWRERAPRSITWPDARGLALIAAGAVVYVIAGLSNIAKEWLQGASLVVSLCGVALLLGGQVTFRWLAPAMIFLIFMFPLPYRVEHFLSWPLQKTAAIGSEYVLQTVGYPTYRDGIVLHCQDQLLEVQNACNGLSMLLTFITLSVAMALVVRRPWLDRGLILLSAIPIAILANIVRIAATGVLYNEAGKELGDRVFHDFAGWMMMPLALGVLLLELKVLDWILLEDLGQASREDVIRMGARPAHLFMTDFEGKGAKPLGRPAVKASGTLPGPPTGTGR